MVALKAEPVIAAAAPSTVTTNGAVPPARWPLTATVASRRSAPSAGESMTTDAVVWSVTCTVCVAVSPFPAVATTCSVFGPADSVTPAENDPALTCAAAPLTVTATLSVESAALAEPCTVTPADVTVLPSMGADTASEGGAVFERTVTEACAVLPAPSVAAAEMTLLPGDSATLALNAPFETVACAPLTLTRTPFASDAVPVPLTLFAAMRAPSWGAVMVIAGGSVSRMTETLAWPLPPRTSVATTAMVFGPSLSGTLPAQVPSGCCTSATPPAVTLAIAYDEVAAASTSMLAPLVSAPSAGELMATVTAGWAMVKPRCADAPLPALSVAATTIECAPGAE